MNSTRRVSMLIGAMLLVATIAVTGASVTSHTLHQYLLMAVLALAATSSRMKVKLPGINGNMSVNLPFLLTAVMTLSSAEAVLVSCVSTAVQCWPGKKAKFSPQQMTFNLSMMAFASAVASLLGHIKWLPGTTAGLHAAFGLVVASAALFLGQTVPVAGVVAWSEGKHASRLWWEIAHLSFPYYVLSAGVTSMVHAVGVHLGWSLALGVFPVMYVVHRSFQTYFTGLAQNTRPEVLVRAARAGL